MPAKKPAALHHWHESKVSRDAREAADAAMLPKTQISKKPPVTLKGHAKASVEWKRLIDLYSELEATIITALDEQLLAQLCLAEEELDGLSKMRSNTQSVWEKHNKLLTNMKPKAGDLKDYFKCLEQVNALSQRYQGFDARMDAKRKMIHTFQQSLYLTPRARAGTAPKERGPEEPPNEMEQLLDE